MPSDEEFLLHNIRFPPKRIRPALRSCETPIAVVQAGRGEENKPDWITFRCKGTGGAEKYVCDE